MTIFDGLKFQADYKSRGRTDSLKMYDWQVPSLATPQTDPLTEVTMGAGYLGLEKTWYAPDLSFTCPSGIGSFPSSAFTLAARAAHVTNAGARHAIICFQYDQTWQTGALIGYTSTNNYATGYTWNDAGTGYSTNGTTNLLGAGEKVLVYTHDGAGNTAIWVDGTSVGTTSTHPTTGYTNINRVSMFAQPNSGSHFYGKTAWAAMWNRKLTNDEIALISTNPNPFRLERGILMPSPSIIRARRF